MPETSPAVQLRTQTLDELTSGLADAKRELFNLRFQLATGQLENTARMKQVKRQAARIRTEMRARELAGQESLWRKKSSSLEAHAGRSVKDS